MPANFTLNDAIEAYLTSRQNKGLSPATLKMDRSILGQFLAAVGNIQVRNIEPRHVDMYFAGKVKLEASSKNTILARLRNFFTWLKARSYISKDPLLDRVRLREGARDNRLFIPVEQFDDLLDAASGPRDRMLLAAGLYLFLRASELQRLKVGDVDLDAGEIRVVITKSADEYGNLDVDKMPICWELDQELRRWLTWYASQVGELKDDMFLIPSQYEYLTVPGPNGRWVRGDQPQWQLRPYRPVSRPQNPIKRSLEAAGFPTHREGGHTLRRSGARALYLAYAEAGDPTGIERVKTMLHHKNVAMTEHYLGIQPARVQRNQKIKGAQMFRKPVRDNVVELRRAGVGDQAGSSV